jgi:hypothetical protein
VAHLISIFRQKLKLGEKDGMFLYSDNKLIRASTTFNDMYNSRQSDGWLYLEISQQEAFG